MLATLGNQCCMLIQKPPHTIEKQPYMKNYFVSYVSLANFIHSKCTDIEYEWTQKKIEL